MNVSFEPLDDEAKAYLSRATGIDYTRTDMRAWFCVTARDRSGDIAGVLACEPKTAFDWAFNAAIVDQHCLTPRLIRTIFLTLFRAGAVRITAEIDPRNERAVRQTRRMGFVYEGYRRRGIDGVRDAMVFGMLAEDCLILKRRPSRRVNGGDYGIAA